jgi:hypothetical protein
MPNNRDGRGTFGAAFEGEGNDDPVMVWMGDPDRKDPSWGGPITLGLDNGDEEPDFFSEKVRVAEDYGDGRPVFVGSILYYAWAVPTGVRVAVVKGSGLTSPSDGSPVSPSRYDIDDLTVSNDKAYWSNKHSEDDPNPYVLTTVKVTEPDGVTERGGVDVLQNLVTYDGLKVIPGTDANPGRDIGIMGPSEASSSNLRRWIVLPSGRAPLMIYSIDDDDDDSIEVQVAPYSYNDHGRERNVLIGAHILGLEEIHLVQAGMVFLTNDNRLIERVYETPTLYHETEIANHIAGIAFRFDPESRLLTVYAAAYGNTVIPKEQWRESEPDDWPEDVPFKETDTDWKKRRLLVETMVWRIRN